MILLDKGICMWFGVTFRFSQEIGGIGETERL